MWAKSTMNIHVPGLCALISFTLEEPVLRSNSLAAHSNYSSLSINRNFWIPLFLAFPSYICIELLYFPISSSKVQYLTYCTLQGQFSLWTLLFTTICTCYHFQKVFSRSKRLRGYCIPLYWTYIYHILWLLPYSLFYPLSFSTILHSHYLFFTILTTKEIKLFDHLILTSMNFSYGK